MKLVRSLNDNRKYIIIRKEERNDVEWPFQWPLKKGNDLSWPLEKGKKRQYKRNKGDGGKKLKMKRSLKDSDLITYIRNVIALITDF